MQTVTRRYWTFLLATLLALLTVAPLTASAAPDSILEKIKIDETLPGGESVEGKLTITSLALSETGQLLASGVFKGEVDGVAVKQVFNDVPSTLSSSSATGASADAVISQSHAACDILFLDLGPLFLDLLGLQIDLSEIVLDIDAVPGAGNLLGNLLCAVVNLLNGFDLNAVLLGVLNNLLAIINDLL